MAATAVEQQAGVPAGTASQAWFSVPEGEVGQITAALATIAHASNPLDMFSIHGLRSLMDDTIESLKQTGALLTGQPGAYTVIHATSAAQVYTLEQAGDTAYSTQAAAQAQAAAQGRNVDQSGKGASLGGINAIGAFFTDLTQRNTWLRAGKVLVGIVLIIVGLVQLTHTEKLLGTAAKGAVLA